MPDFRFAARPFDEQVRFFAAKVNVPTARYDDLWREDHAHGFMVAGATRAALLDDLRDAVHRAITDGETLTQFRSRFDDIVRARGWTGWTGEESAAGRSWRTRVIYDTNVRQSYNAGRFAQLMHPDMIAARPYWQYRHNDIGISRTPRPMHQAWHGLVRHYSDVWWRTHFPQNGWGCKCGTRALSAADVERLGLRVMDPAQGSVDTRGIDPGFEYSPGEAARSQAAAHAFGERVAAMPASWRDTALRDAQRQAGDLFADAAPQIGRAIDATTSPARTISVGMLQPAAAEALGAASTLVDVRADVVQQLLRDGVPDAFLRDIATWLTRPSAIYRDTATGVVVYAWPIGEQLLQLRLADVGGSAVAIVDGSMGSADALPAPRYERLGSGT
ncbi:MAG TPA: phage minor head protein [Tahibacter sp.]|uniref:phage head morphogenesis protein n=1 Tax=Tahibacter sp. TaxID=2056211 RepID=UPI002B6A712A|nr:phage minor head protein [Tahibacter sp.]HSX60257.1 phage minor head protein [Tahibacter sp.]